MKIMKYCYNFKNFAISQYRTLLHKEINLIKKWSKQSNLLKESL